jgi:hypothetical protein
MPIAALVSFFQIVTLVGSALTVIKLFTTGLYRRYRIFFSYFVIRVPYAASVLFFSQKKGPSNHAGLSSDAFFLFFIYTEPILMLFYILVVIELYGLVLERYKGLYTLGRWAMYASILIAVVVSLLTMLPKIAASTPEPSKRLFYEMGAERGIDLALVIFILLIVLFLSHYPVPLSRNVVVHTGIYAVFFLSDTLVLLLRTVFGWTASDGINLCITMLASACSIAWWLLLSAKGEAIQINAPQLRPDDEERILQQLDSLNATLLKVSKK